MLSHLGEIGDALSSGWITVWPTQLLALIWLAWVVELGRGGVLVGTNQDACADPGFVGLSPADSARGDPVVALDFASAGGEQDLRSRRLRHLCAGRWCFLLGVSFTWWARIHLGRFWSNAITHKEDHRVVDTGPYGLVRHPIYTGLILGILATGAAVATWSALLGALLISFGEWQKARMEEGFLTAELGAEAYGPYCRRVPMIVPFLRWFR